MAHTNDLSPETEQDLVILKVQVEGESEFLAVSVGGLGISAGFNAAGISLTGNELLSNDIRPGVPRLLIARAILSASRLGEAMDACLHPQRASSYNNIIADSSGESIAWRVQRRIVKRFILKVTFWHTPTTILQTQCALSKRTVLLSVGPLFATIAHGGYLGKISASSL